jgi:hypothetical protein
MYTGAISSKRISRRAATLHRHRAWLALSLLALAWGHEAGAAATAAADAYDLSVNLSVLGGLQTLVVPPQAKVTNSAQAASFHLTDTKAPISVGSDPVTPLITLTTGNLNAEVQWNPPSGSQGFLVVGAQGSASNVALNVVDLASASLLNLQGQLIRGTALISGYCPPSGSRPAGPSTDSFVDEISANSVYSNGFDNGNLHGGGDSQNDGTTASAGGTGLTIPSNPAANTTLTVPGVAVLVLNEQNTGGNGVTSSSMTVNALHLTLTNVGVLTGEVIIGHAAAAVNCN